MWGGLWGATDEAWALEWFEDSSQEDEVVSGVVEEDLAERLETVFMEGKFLNHDIFQVSVRGEGFEMPILGVSFYLEFDPEALAFLRYEPGGFLERGGDPFYLVKEVFGSGAALGKVVFGETLRRNDDFPIGDGDFAHFYFQEIAPGDDVVYELGFSNGVVSTLDTVRQDIDRVKFVDGRFGRGLVAGGLDGDLEDNSEDLGSGIFDTRKLQTSVLASGVQGSVIWLVIGIAAFSGVAIFYFIKSRFR